MTKTLSITVAAFILLNPAMFFAQETAPATPDSNAALIQTRENPGTAAAATTTATSFPAAALPTQPSAMGAGVSLPLQGLNANALQQMQDELKIRLQEVSRMIGQIDPRDTQFAESLRAEQGQVIEQLKEINAHLKAAGVDTTAAPVGVPGQPLPRQPLPPSVDGLPPGLRGAAGNIPSQEEIDRMLSQGRPGMRDFPGMPAAGMPGTGLPGSIPSRAVGTNDARMQQILDTAQRLRELGMNDLAEETLRQLELPHWQQDRMPPATALPPQTQLPPQSQLPAGGPSGLPGAPPFAPFGTPAAEPAGSPWAIPPSKEIVELKETVASLQSQIEQMRREMKGIETQLQLLNQNILLKLGNPAATPTVTP